MKFLLPSICLWPFPFWLIFKWAKEAGFDGVEILMFGRWTSEKVERVRKKASAYGLVVHFHAPWSLGESNDGITVRDIVLTLLGRLPWPGYKLDSLIPLNARPLVAYSDVLRDFHDGYWIQTDSTGTDYKVPFDEFRKRFSKNPFPTVVDTQHFHEYMAGKPGVSRLTDSRQSYFIDLVGAWEEFGEMVQEVHFNDFNPALGDKKGRNVFPGTGVAPLKEFAKQLRLTGFKGAVVPEVGPKVIAHDIDRLKALRKQLREWFE
jgi:hypothetical protein